MNKPEKTGVFRRTGRFVRQEALNVFGFEHVKQGKLALAMQWIRVSKRICPSCEEGRMIGFQKIIDGKKMKFVGCSRCDHYQQLDLNQDKAAQAVLQAKAREKMSVLTTDETAALVKRHRVGSRILFAASLLMLLFGCAMMINGALNNAFDFDAALSFLGVLMVSAVLFAKGLVASYRSWQLQERIFFVPGSFKRWLKAGLWLA